MFVRYYLELALPFEEVERTLLLSCGRLRASERPERPPSTAPLEALSTTASQVAPIAR
jgi:hypothetical protein